MGDSCGPMGDGRTDLRATLLMTTRVRSIDGGGVFHSKVIRTYAVCSRGAFDVQDDRSTAACYQCEAFERQQGVVC